MQLAFHWHEIEAVSIFSMRVSNPDRSPVGIHGCNAAPTPSRFAEIVSDDFPVFHGERCSFSENRRG
jgi:hypothetical protein